MGRVFDRVLGNSITGMNNSTFSLSGHDVRVLNGSYLHDGKLTSDAHAFAASLIGLLDEMRAFAAKRYLDIYNDSWREDDDPVLDEEGFCAQLTNPSIVLYDELGAAMIYFDDSGMFAGHSIQVSVDGGKIARASMVG